MLNFAPIDLDMSGDLSIRFKLEAFRAGSGSEAGFYDVYDGDAKNYLDWIRQGLDDDPESRVHVWRDGSIVGQVELSARSRFADAGYVHLYFLVPELRGQGLGDDLDDYAAAFFSRRGIDRARLSVNRTNSRALAFYERQGWVRLGPRDDHPESLLFERMIRE